MKDEMKSLLKKGNEMILDREYINQLIVTIVEDSNDLFTLVIDDENVWEVMPCKLKRL